MRLRALVVASVPLAAAAAIGGAYPSSVLPLLGAATVAFLVSGAIIAAPGMAALDLWLVGLAAAVVVQLVPLPDGLVGWIAPMSRDLQSMLQLEPPGSLRTLTIDAPITRQGLESLAAALFVFWAARAVCRRGGLRILLRTLALGGALIAIVSVAQRATSPNLIWWTWAPRDPDVQPFGPFVNRNHFASWLLMATSLTAGYTAAHLHSHIRAFGMSRRRLAHGLLLEGTTLLLAGSIVVMTVTLFATTSRGAILGFCAAAVVGVLLTRGRGRARSSTLLVSGTLLALTAWAVWLNFDVLSARLVEGGPASRWTIWRETLPIVRDFPWTGTGLGTYPEAMLRYQQTNPRVLFNQAHNEYLQLAAEGGLLLLVPVAGAVARWLSIARTRLREEREGMLWIRAGAVAGLAGMAVHSLWETPLRTIANATLLAVLAAIVVHDREPRPPDSNSAS